MTANTLNSSPMPAFVAPTLGAATIQTWLAAKLAKLVRISPEQVNIRQTFAQYGLDSMQAARLSGDLEEWLGRELSPSLIYDYPTIESLTNYLAAECR